MYPDLSGPLRINVAVPNHVNDNENIKEDKNAVRRYPKRRYL
jgi:hypothetical protein